MIEQYFKDVYDEKLAEGAIINDRHTGFKNDYLTLHCLLRKYNPATVFECGTHVGFGTKIICNAVPEATVYSLDLPDDEAEVSKQHPLSEGKPGVGVECDLPFVQLRGDSRYFNFEEYPCEAYWIDAEHTKENVRHETEQIMVRCYPDLVIWHDTDMTEVMDGILEAMARNQIIRDFYRFYRIVDTRITYALKK